MAEYTGAELTELIVEALSWSETLEVGRIGDERARELLAAHDAEVARQAEARALNEAADDLYAIADDYDMDSELHAALRECDLDTAHWLRARADRNDSEGAS